MHYNILKKKVRYSKYDTFIYQQADQRMAKGFNHPKNKSSAC